LYSLALFMRLLSEPKKLENESNLSKILKNELKHSSAVLAERAFSLKFDPSDN